MEFFVFLIACILLKIFFEELGPYIGSAFVGAFQFLAEVLEVGTKALVRGVFWLIAALFRLLWRAAVLAGRGTGLTFTFLFYLTAEWIRGPRSDEAEFEFAFDEEMDSEELYRAARQRLGLPNDFTRAALDAAYKQAMKRAHPDIGGSDEQAQEINTSRDLLMRRKGWA